MIKYFILFVGTLITANVFASAPDTLWTRTFGGTDNDYGNSVQQTSDGGFIIAGITYSFGTGYSDVYLIKTNSSGNTLWTKTFGGTNDDESYSVQRTQDGGFIIAGYTTSFGAGYYDVYLIKTDSLGDTLWTKTIGGTGGEMGYSVQQTQEGGFIIAGWTNSFGAGNSDVYLIKTDSLGDTLWTKTFGGTGWDEGKSVQQTQDNGFIIAGWTNSFGAGDYDVYLIKTNSLGDTLWTKTFGGTGWDEGWSIQQTQDSGFIIAGWTNSFQAGYPDVYLIKTNSSGDTLWTKTFGGTGDDRGYSVQQTQDSGFIIAGETESFGAGTPSYPNVYLIKTNSSGDTLWEKTIGGTGWDDGKSVQQTQDGGFVIAGRTGSFGVDTFDVYLIRLGKEVGIEENRFVETDYNLSLSQNPFSKSTVINYVVGEVSQPRYVSLNLYDIAGKCVKTLINESKPAGTYTTTLNANELKTGIYFLTLSTICHSERSEESNGIRVTKKLTVLK
ncbi:MAG: T9SS type A sorting domain-containing protein [bacterium]|nr:T9SS type A sorting domain-containing protein [bacterium]